MRIAKTAVGVGLAVGALLGGAAQASAAPGDFSEQYYVTAWHDVNVRVCASTNCAIEPAVVKLYAKQKALGVCWEHGESITDFGITNDNWVKISIKDVGAGYVSGLYLLGNERGNLPTPEVCLP
ncbi:MAG: hypothetical protein ABIQ18_20900 [Umezawaea sp.]|jgi:hypothetical protein